MMIFLIRMYCIKHKNFKRQTLFSKEGKKFYKQKLHSGLNVYWYCTHTDSNQLTCSTHLC